jgi:hypothetical protein
LGCGWHYHAWLFNLDAGVLAGDMECNMIDMIILDANLDDGSGEIFVTSEFNKLDGLLKADILQEWIGLLELQYEYALRELNH